MYHSVRGVYHAPQIDGKQPTMALGSADLLPPPVFKERSSIVPPYRGPDEFPALRKAKQVVMHGYGPSKPGGVSGGCCGGAVMAAGCSCGSGVVGGAVMGGYRAKTQALIKKHLF